MTTDRLQYVRLLAATITENFGERCPEFDPNCYCCRGWTAYDRLVEFSEHESPSTTPKPSSEPTP